MGKKGRKAVQAAKRPAAAARDESDDESPANAIHPKLAKLGALQAKKSPGWTNRQRTLAFSSRGVSFQLRHLVNDLRVLMPHSKKEGKMDRKSKIGETIPEICEMRNCNNCIFVEMRKKMDAYMWVSKLPSGPSVRFLMQNVHTMDELKLTGNSLRGARPLLHFDPAFETAAHWRLIKELFFQAFGTPRLHPKSKPFVDRVMSFFVLDNRVWIRTYQITWREPGKIGKDSETTLTEVGPRIVLQPIRIFEGTFGGPTLYENPDYVSPNQRRSELRKLTSLKYREKVLSKELHAKHVERAVLPEDPIGNPFAQANKAVLRAENTARDEARKAVAQHNAADEEDEEMVSDDDEEEEEEDDSDEDDE